MIPPNWKILNEERLSLIEKKYDQGLDKQETIRLAELRKIAREVKKDALLKMKKSEIKWTRGGKQ